ncbi:MAG: hypothetical protein WC325_01200 [Candidatus Bathyarchaeia archaeon]
MYNELYELWKTEKEITGIQRLPNSFYSKIADYVQKLKEENRMLDKKTTKSKLMDTEFRYVKLMVCEILEIRFKKLREKALSRENVARDVLTEEEAKMFDSVLPLTENYQAFCKDILRGHLSAVKKDVKRMMTVLRFVQEIPALVGADMKTYGPFGPEDIATLPPENARLLVKQGVAVEVDAK